MNTVYFINEEITVDITLYKWNNINNDDFATMSEYEALGTVIFNVTGGDGNKPNRVKLPNTLNNGKIPLEDNQDYFIAIEYRAAFLINYLR